MKRAMSSPAARERQMLARAIRQRPLSPVEQAIARIGREMSSPEMREKLRRRQELLEVCGVAERVLGKPRPIPPAQPENPAEPDKLKRKRRPGGGRHRSLAQKNIDDGIDTLTDKPRMPRKQALRALRAAGIEASSDYALYTYIIRRAHGPR